MLFSSALIFGKVIFGANVLSIITYSAVLFLVLIVYDLVI
jgi:hypothetical protein